MLALFSSQQGHTLTFEEIQFEQCFVTNEGQSCWDSFTIHIIYVQSKHVWRRMEDFLNNPPYLAKPQWFTSKSPLEVTRSSFPDTQQYG